MRKRSTLHCLRTHPRVLYPSGLAPRAGIRGRRRWRAWRMRGLVALAMSGLLLLVAAVLGHPGPSQGARSPVPQGMQHTPVVIVQEDTLPPVMQRIAQCESWGQHFTRDGKVLRGKRNPQDMGLFQINTLVWGKKAEELGYDIRVREGNAQMARYIFENYGSVPWHASAKCWSRVS
jgi:hypothetical protein